MKVGIIGAGLAGLSCAVYLKKSGVEDITIFESSDQVGGKLRTDIVGNYQLDRGFQVLLPSYPETKALLDYSKLELQYFEKGSIIFNVSKVIPFFDPANGLIPLIKTVLNGPGSLIDKLKLLKLKNTLRNLTVDEIFSNPQKMSSLTYLKQLGFSTKIINEFWVPFYQGVFLENDLTTDFKMLQFTFKMFSDKGAAVPKLGMQAIPNQLATTIGLDKIKLNAPVLHFDNITITSTDGTVHTFDKVVLACNLNQHITYHSVTNIYFEAASLPINSKHVMLNANENRLVNNVVFISNIASNYAKSGKHLISVSANGIHNDLGLIIKDLNKMFGSQVNAWNLVKTYIIKEALPLVDLAQKPQIVNKQGVYCCSDFLIQGSINGAIKSARLAAEQILKL